MEKEINFRMNEHANIEIDNLKQVLEIISMVMNSNPLPVLIVEPESNILVSANEAALEKLGFDQKEIYNLSLHRIHVPDELPYLLLEIEKPSQYRKIGKWKIKTKEGKVSSVYISVTDINIDQKQLKLINYYPEKINYVDSEEKLKIVIKSAPLFLFAVDREGIFIFIEGKGGDFNFLPDKLKGKSALRIFGRMKIKEDTGNTILVRDAFKRVLQKINVTGTIKVEEYFFEIILSPVEDNYKNITGVMGIAVNITDRIHVEDEREKLLRDVINTERRLKMLSKRLIEVQENERKHISRELHDDIGQVLTAIKIELQTACKYDEAKKLKEHLAEIIDLSDQALQRTRNLSRDLRPSLLDDIGLIPAIRWYIDKEGQRAGIKTKIVSEAVKKYPSSIEITCYRLVQESITNILRHAKAKNVIVKLYDVEDNLHLKIIDNGVGFDVYATIKKSIRGGSMGVLGMQERVELVGGELRIKSSGKGTEIHAIFPLKELRNLEE